MRVLDQENCQRNNKALFQSICMQVASGVVFLKQNRVNKYCPEYNGYNFCLKICTADFDHVEM